MIHQDRGPRKPCAQGDSSDSTAGPETLFLSEPPGPGVVSALRDLVRHLGDTRYELIATLPLPGGLQHLPLDIANLPCALTGRSNLLHRSGAPWLYDALARRKSSEVVTLHRLFHRCGENPTDRTRELLGEGLFADMLEAGILEATPGGVRSRLMLTPHGGRIYASDPMRYKTHPDFVYMGRPSFIIADAVLQSIAGDEAGRTGGRLLDLGCGCGNIGIAVAPHFDEVLGTDIVQRCLTFARLNAAVAGTTNCRFAYSDLFEDVDGTFDVIVANTPSGWIDPAIESARTYSTGGAKFGGELPQRILAASLERLNPDGRTYSLLTAPVIGRQRHVVDLLEAIFDRHEVHATVYPLYEEYNYKRARLYRQHRIRKMVRYMVVIERQAGRFSISFERSDSLRLWSYRLRAGITRIAAAVSLLGRSVAASGPGLSGSKNATR